MSTISIPLTQGKFALIDEDDFEIVSRHKWSLAVRTESHSKREYAQAFVDGKMVLMHRLIIGANPGEIVDHVCGDGLDNRRSNLRKATPSENNQNQPMQGHNPWGFKGVSPNKNRWRARIRLNGNEIHLGTFDTREQAAHAYDDAARQLYGQFGRFNFPQEGERSARAS